MLAIVEPGSLAEAPVIERSPFIGLKVWFHGKPTRLSASEAKLMAAVARVAVQLARADAHRFVDVNTIAADALSLFSVKRADSSPCAETAGTVGKRYEVSAEWLSGRRDRALDTYCAKCLGLSPGHVRFLATVTRLAVQLSRERAGQYEAINDLIADAVGLAAAAFKARQAVEVGGDPNEAFNEAEPLASRYVAEIVRNCDRAGMVFGIRFSSGRFSSGANHWFFVA